MKVASQPLSLYILAVKDSSLQWYLAYLSLYILAVKDSSLQWYLAYLSLIYTSSKRWQPPVVFGLPLSNIY